MDVKSMRQDGRILKSTFSLRVTWGGFSKILCKQMGKRLKKMRPPIWELS
jgi:hypothetical protein